MRQLIFVHGRSQEHKDSFSLKAEWLNALRRGLEKSNLQLPIGEHDVRFPYYGDTLYDLVEGRCGDSVSNVVVRGESGANSDETRFTLQVMHEIQRKAGLSDLQVSELAGDEALSRGPLNWSWIRAILKAIDTCVPNGSATSLALFTHDVYQYLGNSVIRDRIERGIVDAITPGVEAVVVAHSLGTVVSYNLLRREGHLRTWKVPLYITLGSPLGISAIRKSLKNFAPIRCPECARSWFNAMDMRDVVALYPLDTNSFPLNPENPGIENKTDVNNHTENRHGIAGYLDDQEVAQRIYRALTI